MAALGETCTSSFKCKGTLFCCPSDNRCCDIKTYSEKVFLSGDYIAGIVIAILAILCLATVWCTYRFKLLCFRSCRSRRTIVHTISVNTAEPATSHNPTPTNIINIAQPQQQPPPYQPDFHQPNPTVPYPVNVGAAPYAPQTLNAGLALLQTPNPQAAYPPNANPSAAPQAHPQPSTPNQ